MRKESNCLGWGGGGSRQLDFVLIDQRHRNWDANTTNKLKGNPQQHAQRKMIISKMRIKLSKEYHDIINNGLLRYNINNFRK